MSSEFVPLERGAVDGIIQLAGTTLGTSRCDAFKTDHGQDLAERALRAHAIGALIVIGGNGSQSGAYALLKRGVNVIGVASTIDNDLEGTEVSIGTTSAQQVAVEAMDRLKITATSHERAFLIEVMGRHSGYLATVAAIAGGADALVVPECEQPPETLATQLWNLHESGQRHAIVVVGEGATRGAHALADYFAAHAIALPFELRVARLGHTQRAGGPNVYDRTLATRFGVAAIEQVAAENYGMLVGLRDGAIKTTPLSEIAGRTRAVDPQLLTIANTLTRRTPAPAAKGEACI